MSRLATTIVLFLSGAAAAGADQFVSNPDFDTDVADWFGAGIAWSPDDVRDDPGSGSATIEIPPFVAAPIQSGCFPVGPGQRIVFGGNVKFDAVKPDLAWAGARLATFQLPDCGGDSEYTPFPALEAKAEDWGWSPTQATAATPPGAQSARLQIWLISNGPDPVRFWIDGAFAMDGWCAPQPAALCLQEERFLATVKWETPAGARGVAGVHPITDDTGAFWFFDPSILEVFLKVLDGCGYNERYWVFAAGLTNLQVELDVTDTHSGEIWSSDNPLDQPFPPYQDIEAFDGCRP